ncbi:hypothetical protein MSPP1_000489 [Malassezia sp. CBS 17886]|nr:hypothetical protein MSPP1_000489 [Malassezia sp. CBS 17886]
MQALARIIDTRSGYYEERRLALEQLARIKHAGVRAYYEEQNEVLDGWREVDEILESQFPTEVMRRFAVPQQNRHGAQGPGTPSRDAQKRSDEQTLALSRAPDDDDGYATDAESDSIWTHPFSHRSTRRQRRISERALSSLSGMYYSLGTPSALSRAPVSATGDTAMESSPERVPALVAGMRPSGMLGDVKEEQSESQAAAAGDRMGATDALPRSDARGVTRGEGDAADGGRGTPHSGGHESEDTHSPENSREAVRRILHANPAVQRRQADARTYGAIGPGVPGDYDAAAGVLPDELNERWPQRGVWTKADDDRKSLLQNVPTHQRKLDTESFVQWYINVNLLVNFLLVVGKVIAVFSSNSVSLMASLVDSALDLLCTVVIFISSKATAYRSWHTFYKYPVGKRRLEPLGVLIFSVLMVVSFLQVLLESVNRLWATVHHASPEGEAGLPLIGIVFMLLTIVIKTAMWLWCHRSKNSSVRAIALDSENDIVFNIFSLLFPMLDKYLGLRILDPIGGGALSVYIIFEWVATMADTTSKLTGQVANEVDVSRCLYMVSRFSLVKAIAGFELYHAGDTMVAEVDVVLPMSFQLKEAHDLGEHLDYNPAGQSGHIGQRG